MNTPTRQKPTVSRVSTAALCTTLVLLYLFPAALISRATQKPEATGNKKADAAAQQDRAQPAKHPGDQDLQCSNKVSREGVTIEMSAEPANKRKDQPTELIGGDDAIITFKISDTATGTPLGGARPAAWIDLREGKQTTGKDCREKIQAFLQASLAARPTLDLNSYYVLALNREPTISVIDPMLGYGTTKLLTLVFLNNPGEDWVQTKDGKKILVTIPASNQVAVVDTTSFKVVANVSTGIKPGRIALQNDQRYAWVGCAAVPEANHPAGVSVIDTASNAVVSNIQTGAGDHDIVFSEDDRYAFISNSSDGTLSIVDVSRLALVKNIKVGKEATSMAYSPLSNAVYVSDETSGAISVIDARRHEIVSTIKFSPGIGMVRFASNGRTGVVVNGRENTASAFDSATNKLIQRFDVEPAPDQVSFTADFAYIRSMKSDHVTMIPLTGLDKGGTVEVVRIPAGQAAPDRSGPGAIASPIVPAPESGSVLIASPTDKTIYYYTEGMAAPMGNFQNYKREPRAVTVVDRSIRQTATGVYSATVRVPESGGNYDVAFLLDAPRVTYCFDLAVKPSPEYAKRNSQNKVRVDFLMSDTRIPVRQKVSFRFKLTDPKTKQPKAGLKDVGVLAMLAASTWQDRQWASEVEQGVYEISFVPPDHGVYYMFIECPSLKVKLNELPFVILDGRQQTTEEKAAEKADAKPAAQTSQPGHE